MTEHNYNPQALEENVQQYWLEQNSFAVHQDDTREKFYCLAMFPYPSGQLHMGHVRNYTIADVIARYQRMQGKNVLQPMGWDAFGLPAENADIKHNVPPAQWTAQNIKEMRAQLQRVRPAFVWQPGGLAYNYTLLALCHRVVELRGQLRAGGDCAEMSAALPGTQPTATEPHWWNEQTRSAIRELKSARARAGREAAPNRRTR